MKQTIFRINQKDFSAIEHLARDSGKNETQAFALCSRAEGKNATIFVAKHVLIPGKEDLEEQSAAGVAPTAQFQAIAYGLAYDLGLSVLDIHTHPFTESVHLSSTDFRHGERNGRDTAEVFPQGCVMGMIALGSSLDSFDGRVWSKEEDCFHAVDHMEVLGSPIQILPRPLQKSDDTFSRHSVIPMWNQARLGQLKVLVAGLGGNGSLVFSALVSMGVGAGDGWIRACDPDLVEASNLSRIPYAIPRDVGRSKAEIAQLHALRKAPGTEVVCYDKTLRHDDVMEIAKEAHLLIGAVDTEGCRKTLNSLAARYLIPYVDIATEIIPGEQSCQSLGQIHAFVPGVTGCLMCSGLVDTSEAAMDQLSEDENAERARVGYVRGTDETPTPSVLHLNGVASYLAVAQLIRLVFEQGIEKSSFLNYEQQDCRLASAQTCPDPGCPVCGNDGYLGTGDAEDHGCGESAEPAVFQMSSGRIVEGESATVARET